MPLNVGAALKLPPKKDKLFERILQPRDDAGQVTIFGKGGKTRVMLLPASVWQELDGLGRGPEAPVFRSRRGGHLDASAVERIVQKATARAGIVGTSFGATMLRSMDQSLGRSGEATNPPSTRPPRGLPPLPKEPSHHHPPLAGQGTVAQNVATRGFGIPAIVPRVAAVDDSTPTITRAAVEQYLLKSCAPDDVIDVQCGPVSVIEALLPATVQRFTAVPPLICIATVRGNFSIHQPGGAPSPARGRMKCFIFDARTGNLMREIIT